MNRRAIKKCPRCGIGVLKKRNGKYGQFWGCNEYPNCRYTAKLDDIDQQTFEEKVADFMKEEHVCHKTNWLDCHNNNFQIFKLRYIRS